MNAATSPGWTFYVRDHGIALATRNRGRQVAEHLSALAAERPGLIEVNFDGCEVATAPFMDELLRVCKALGDRIIYSCLNEDVHAALTFVENRMAES